MSILMEKREGAQVIETKQAMEEEGKKNKEKPM